MFDAQGLGSLCYSGGDFLRSESPMLGLKWEFQILAHGIVRIQRVVLEHQCDVALGSAPVSDILSADRDAASIRRIQTRDQSKGGGFPRAGGSEQDEELAVLNIQGELAQRRVATELLGDAL